MMNYFDCVTVFDFGRATEHAITFPDLCDAIECPLDHLRNHWESGLHAMLVYEEPNANKTCIFDVQVFEAFLLRHMTVL